MARGNVQNLKRSADEVFNKVASRESRRKANLNCGTSPRGSKNRVCVSTHTIPGMKCGLNRITKLYGCAVSSKEGPRRRRKRK